MQCPTCLKMKLRPAYFCSQNCFKANWNTHKLLHTAPPVVDDLGSSRPEFNHYAFTGPLRPAQVTPKRVVPPHIGRPDYAEDPEGKPRAEDSLRGNHTIALYSQDVIKRMKKAGRIAAEVLETAGKMAKPGVTTDEIDRVVHEKTVELGGYPSPLNYRGFPKSVCTSVNEVICHGIPDMRCLEDGDICNVDVTVYVDGVHADVNETWYIGNVAEEHKHLVTTAYECLEQAIASVKPGQFYREIGNIINKHATKNGYSVVRTYCGHGIGELFHTAPNVPHYANNKAIGVMKPGHIFTIEPMINAGKWGDDLWPDDWTAVTKDGKRSAQFEHTLLVTDTGVEILTKRRNGTYIDRF
uniref:Methionine aminopeptidase n=1 Tax=Arcella intermedia TaxID=1963864 RepID=A0A6B2L832_9EUKA